MQSSYMFCNEIKLFLLRLKTFKHFKVFICIGCIFNKSNQCYNFVVECTNKQWQVITVKTGKNKSHATIIIYNIHVFC